MKNFGKKTKEGIQILLTNLEQDFPKSTIQHHCVRNLEKYYVKKL